MTLHPIAETLARLAAVDEHFRAQLLTAPDAEPGWRSAATLCAMDAPHLNEILARVAVRYKAEGRQPAVALWFSHYAFSMMAVAIACYLVENRVPELFPESVWSRFEANGDLAAFAWRGRKFAALPEDPSASHPDCFILSSKNLLRAYLRASIVPHLASMIEALSLCSSLGKPGLWALAADSCASAFTWVGDLLGNPALALAEARAFNADPSPLQRKRDFIHIEHCGIHYEMLERTSCCLYFKVEGGEYCSICPHRPQEERVDRIKNWLEKRAVEGSAA